MRNKQKAWRLGAAVLRHMTFTTKEGREVAFPAARIAKELATNIGMGLRNWIAPQTPTLHNVPSWYVAPRRRSLQVTDLGDGFVLIGQPQEVA